MDLVIPEIEQKILSLACRPDNPEAIKWVRDELVRSRLKKLLKMRRNYLNLRFVPTVESMNRFKSVNQLLLDKTRELFDRVASLKLMVKDVRRESFDNDIEFEGQLRFIYDDDDSVLKLDDDYLYGSDFHRIIHTIYLIHEEERHADIEYTTDGVDKLNDGNSWVCYPFSNREEFTNVTICHAVKNLTNDKLYSIPDIVRLNDFWAEAKIVFHNFSSQPG